MDDTPTDRGETDFGGHGNRVWVVQNQKVCVRDVTLHSGVCEGIRLQAQVVEYM
jgi:hypothetical protein